MSQLQQALNALAAADAAGNQEDAQVLADLVRQLQGQEKEAKSVATPVNPLGAGIAGVIAGQVAGPMVNKAVEGYQESRAARTGASAPTATAAAKAPAGGFVPTPDQHTRIIQGGIDESGTTGRARQQGYNERTAAQALQKESAEKNMQDLARRRIITGESPLTKIAAPTSTPSGIVVPGSAVYEAPPAAKAPTMASKIGAKIPQPIQNLGRQIGGVGQDIAAAARGAAQSGVTPYLGRSIAGAGTAVQGADAYNRFQQGDMVGGGLGALSSLGSAAALVPHPVTRIGGPALSITAEMLQSYIDKQRAGEQKKAEGGLVNFAEGGSTSPAWQRSEGKNPEGGLNAAGRASYNRETGGNLKAPQPEGGSRKKSFCARMSGMKKKLTSSETANDPDSRINKSLRKWKC